MKYVLVFYSVITENGIAYFLYIILNAWARAIAGSREVPLSGNKMHAF